MDKRRHKPKKWAVKRSNLSTRQNKIRWKTPEGLGEWTSRRFCIWDGYPPTKKIILDKIILKEMYDDVDLPL